MTYNVPDSNGPTFINNINACLNDLDNKKLTPTGDGTQLTNVNATSVNGLKIWTGTLAQYNAIVTKDPNTVYNING